MRHALRLRVCGKVIKMKRLNLKVGIVGIMHYSFEYAQNVHYPSNPQQPGPAYMYFKSLCRCGLFGITCEPLGFQVNYLVGKGANATISLLDHFLYA